MLLTAALSSTTLTGCHELYCSFVEGLTGVPLDCSHDAFPEFGDIEFPPLPPPPTLPTTTTTTPETPTTSTSSTTSTSTSSTSTSSTTTTSSTTPSTPSTSSTSSTSTTLGLSAAMPSAQSIGEQVNARAEALRDQARNRASR